MALLESNFPRRNGVSTARARQATTLWFIACALALAGGSSRSDAQTAPVNALQAIPSVDLAKYVGTWYQVALFPNKFQSQCLSETSAMYRALPGGQVDVTNSCRNASGAMEDALGLARPRGDISGTVLSPAKLQVSFLPAWLRWLPVGWGDYWVIQLPSDYRYVVISEPKRKYLWVLSRAPQLSSEDNAVIRATLVSQGFDLTALQVHPQTQNASSQ